MIVGLQPISSSIFHDYLCSEMSKHQNRAKCSIVRQIYCTNMLVWRMVNSLTQIQMADELVPHWIDAHVKWHNLWALHAIIIDCIPSNISLKIDLIFSHILLTDRCSQLFGVDTVAFVARKVRFGWINEWKMYVCVRVRVNQSVHNGYYCYCRKLFVHLSIREWKFIAADGRIK